MIKNKVKERLARDELAIGVLLRQTRTVDTVRAMAACGFDWLFIDMEHGSISLDSVAQLSQMALVSDIAPIVRVPIMDVRTAARALDNGALGVILPRVETRAQAEEIAAKLRYAPRGHRSVIGTLPHYDFRPPPLTQATREMDEQTLLIVIIETPTAVANIEAIAAVAGIDVLLIGSNDLTLEMGIHGQFGHAEYKDAVQRVIAAGKRHGKTIGLGGVNDEAILAEYIQQGVRFLPTLADIQYLMEAASRRSALLRGLWPTSQR